MMFHFLFKKCYDFETFSRSKIRLNNKNVHISPELDQHDIEQNPIQILFKTLAETLDEIKGKNKF